MGCAFSCKSSNSIKCIRVVHLNGYIEDFDHPVTVSEVTRNSEKHFVCTHAQLLYASSKPLMPDTLLQPGQIYFSLPYSVFQSSASPMDFARMARKLTNLAKTTRSNAESGSTNSSFRLDGRSPSWRSPASSPDRFSDKNGMKGPENGVAVPELRKSTKSRSWKPILSTIRERSFNRRSESDILRKEEADK